MPYDLQALRELGPYISGQEIAKNNTHQLLRLRHEDGHTVVLKALRSGYPDERAVGAIRHEYAILERLSIEGVVSARALKKFRGMPALLLEDAGLRNLADRIRLGPLSLEEFLPLAIGLAATLQDLHTLGVVHRDICPANIVLDEEGRTTLVDFGASVPMARLETEFVPVNALEGTLAYMAPEQSGRTGKVLDHRCDLYALGATFYELLTGVPPFEGQDPLELIHAHLTRAAVPLLERCPKLPPALSKLVHKLLAKAPEQRYQSARALRLALEQLYRQHTKAEPEVSDEQVDPPRGLQFDRLYGQNQALTTAHAAVLATLSGAAKLLVISGPAGAGKTTFVRELYHPVAAHRGYFISGRFEAASQHRPYHGLLEAFHWLSQHALTWPQQKLQGWLQGLKERLGTRLPLLGELTPELLPQLGLPSTPVGLEPDEHASAIAEAACVLLREFGAHEAPLALFLDDFQHADPASLLLVERLALNLQRPYFMLILAHQQGQEGSGTTGPFLKNLLEQHPSAHQLTLGPLTVEAIQLLLSDVLHHPPDAVHMLAHRLYQHTYGNPLLVRQLLEWLVRQGTLVQDERGDWSWDTARLEGLEPRQDVLELILEDLHRLPTETLEALAPASALGGSFELELLAQALQRPALEVADALWPAVLRGLIAPAQASYQVLRKADALGDELTALNATFRFLHPRIAQALWEALPTDTRERLALRLGRVSLLAWRQKGQPERLFEALFHLHRVATTLTSALERLDLARLFLTGAQLARQANGVTTALEFAHHGLELVTDLPWSETPELLYGLHLEEARAAVSLGQHARARTLMNRAIQQLELTPHFVGQETALLELHGLVVQDLCATGDYVEAIAAGRVGCTLSGTPLPFHDLEERMQEELLEVQRLLSADGLRRLETQEVTDPTALARLNLLTYLAVAGYFAQQDLLDYCMARVARLSLELGLSPQAPHCLTYAGMLLGKWLNDMEQGHAVGRLAVQLARRAGTPLQRGRSLHIFGTHLNHWAAPLQESIQVLRESIASGLEAGDVPFTAFASAGLGLNLLGQGEPLHELLQSCAWGLGYCRQHQLMPMELLHFFMQSFARFLTLQIDEDELETWRTRTDELERQPQPDRTVLTISRILRLWVSHMYGDVAAGAYLVKQISPDLPYISGLFVTADFHLLAGLVQLQLLDGASPEERPELEQALEEHIRFMEHHADTCPDNFLHRLEILEGERARVQGNPLLAAELLNRAAEAARSTGFLQDEALAHELVGKLWWRRGLRLAAQGHLQAAARCYALWGAGRKLQVLSRQFPDLELGPVQTAARGPLTDVSSSGPAPVDALSLVKASASVLSELQLDRLMERLLQVMLEHAGAGYAVLIMLENGHTRVKATLEPGGRGFERHEVPLESSMLASLGMISYTERTLRPLVVGSAETSGLFRDDPYVQARRPRSVLVLPMVHRTRTVAFLYLENNLIPHAFGPQKLEALLLLGTWLAIALENGRLYQGMQNEIGERVKAEEALRELNQALELRVQERTRTLERVNAELEQFAYITSHDLQEPLRTIAGFLGLLEEDFGAQLPDEGRQFVRLAIQGATRMRDLIRDLLAWSRAGGLDVPLTPTDLNVAWQQVTQNLRAALHETGAILEVGALPTVKGSMREVQQILQNLLSNALKFRSATVPFIRLTAEPRERLWEIRVQDNGIGIAPAHHQKIFQVFQRLHGREQYPGTGIGLAIVRKVVERLGGTIWVESEPGKGATFCFTLQAVES